MDLLSLTTGGNLHVLIAMVDSHCQHDGIWNTLGDTLLDVPQSFQSAFTEKGKTPPPLGCYTLMPGVEHPSLCFPTEDAV